jgi:hypothetical protein
VLFKRIDHTDNQVSFFNTDYNQSIPLLLNPLVAPQFSHSVDPLFFGGHGSTSVFPSSDEQSLAADALSSCPCKTDSHFNLYAAWCYQVACVKHKSLVVVSCMLLSRCLYNTVSWILYAASYHHSLLQILPLYQGLQHRTNV